MCISTGNFDSIFISRNCALFELRNLTKMKDTTCLLYTSDAADDMQCVDLGGRRIIKKKIFFKQETAYEM